MYPASCTKTASIGSSPCRDPLLRDKMLEDEWMDKWMMVQILFVTAEHRFYVNITVTDSFVVQM